jgi:CheY-like chemotaxis protein
MNIEQLDILVVEESDALREATVEQLRALGALRIVAVASGGDALARMQLHRFDVVLSGWNMKVMDGLALLKAIRADDRLKSVAMVMVTADAEPRQIEQAIAGGVSELLVKPYTRQQLQTKIASSIEHADRPVNLADLAGPAPRSTDEPPAIPTLLVVDDTPENIDVITQHFADDYRIRVARNGDRALQICTGDDAPDLVLLDVMMPGMDGFEVARRMRAHPSSEHIPVIFVTALAAPVHERQGLDLGAVDFVTKPIDPDLLRLRVRNFMRLVTRQKQRQVECDAQLSAARLREGIEEILRHDIKNPLAGAIGFARLLAMDRGLSAPQARMVRLIEDATTQALHTLNMSSEMFRIQAGRYRLAPVPVDLGQILGDVAAMAHAWHERKALVFQLDTGAAAGKGSWAAGDPSLCLSIFHNLLRNACEAAPAGSTVEIRTFDESPVRIEIRNAGVVPAAARPGFFDRYVTSGKRGGSGLGTYSARLLVEAQGGHIAMATDDERRETVLTVVLPRGEPPAPTRLPAAQEIN